MSLPPPLSDRDRAVLEFEGSTWWRFDGSKQQAIRDQFGLSVTRYYQVLNALLDEPAAAVADPVLVRRLREVRAERQRQQRGGRRLAS